MTAVEARFGVSMCWRAMSLIARADVRRPWRRLLVHVGSTLAAMSATHAIFGVGVGVPLGLAVGRAVWRAVAEGAAVAGDPAVPARLLGTVGPAAIMAAVMMAVLPAGLALRRPPGLALRAE